jgi:AhpD family alkylhydroperoxidase
VAPRIDYRTQSAPGALDGMRALEQHVRQSGLGPLLLELVKTRASQLNGCAFCIDMHTKDARAHGETEQRLYGLSAWRDAPFYSSRERAALEWTEALTLVAGNDVPDDLYARVRQHFDERQLVDLTLAIVAINGWNRLAISLRFPEPGSHKATPHS